MELKKEAPTSAMVEAERNSLVRTLTNYKYNESISHSNMFDEYFRLGINPIAKQVKMSIHNDKFQWLELVNVNIKHYVMEVSNFPHIKLFIDYNIYHNCIVGKTNSIDANRNYYFLLSILNIYNNSNIEDLINLYSHQDIPKLQTTRQLLRLLLDRLPLSAQHINVSNDFTDNTSDAFLLTYFLPEDVRDHYTWDVPGVISEFEQYESYKADLGEYLGLIHRAESSIKKILNDSLRKFYNIIVELQQRIEENIQTSYPILSEFCNINDYKLDWKISGKDNISIENQDFLWFLVLNYQQFKNIDTPIHFLKDFFRIFGLDKLNLTSKNKLYRLYISKQKYKIFEEEAGKANLIKYRIFILELQRFLSKYYELSDIVRDLIKLPEK